MHFESWNFRKSIPKIKIIRFKIQEFLKKMSDVELNFTSFLFYALFFIKITVFEILSFLFMFLVSFLLE